MRWRSSVGSGIRVVAVVLAALAMGGGVLAGGAGADEAGATRSEALVTGSEAGAIGSEAGATEPEAQQPFTIQEVLAPPYPRDLVAAREAERIAWIAYDEGMRNVYTAAAPDFEPVRLTDYLEDDGVDLTDLRISADGSVVVYVRGHDPNREGWVANPASDPRGAERAVWAVETDGSGEPWKVVVAGDPALSPEGRWVAFDRDGQIWRAPVEPKLAGPAGAGGSGGEGGPLFRAYGDNRDPVWSPDGSRIAFVSDRDNHSLIGLYDVEDPSVSYMAPGVDYDHSPTFSPDGSRIAFIRRPGASFGQQVSDGRRFPGFRRQQEREEGEEEQAEVPGLRESSFAGGYKVSFRVGDVESGEAREFWHDQPGDDSFQAIRRIDWAGDRVVFEAEPGNWRHIYSVPLEGPVAEPVDLTPGEGFAEQTALSPDGETLYWAGNVGDIDRRHLWRTSTAGGPPTQMTRGSGIETYPVALPSGRVAVLSAGARQPQSVALVAADGGSPERIFPDLSDFPAEAHVVPENVTLTAEDGLEFRNQLFLPSDIRPGERRPAVLFTHGGSRRQMLLGYHYMHFYHMAYAINQYLASRGYVVISVNYRSGIGYGEEFRNAPGRGGRGNTEYQDVRAAGRYLQGRDDVDPERIGLWGLSYGGILTAQGLARNSDIFAAGVDMAGVHLWGDSLDPESTSYQSSAIAAIDDWTSPVLLIHGDDDRNVAFGQTVGLVQLLRAHGVPHELIVFPDEVHDFLLHERWLIAFRAMDEFFDRHLRAEPTQ